MAGAGWSRPLVATADTWAGSRASFPGFRPKWKAPTIDGTSDSRPGTSAERLIVPAPWAVLFARYRMRGARALPRALSWRWLATITLTLCSTATGTSAQSIDAIRAAAEGEGSLVWYAAMRSEHIELIAAQFRRDFPKIKIETIYLT